MKVCTAQSNQKRSPLARCRVGSPTPQEWKPKALGRARLALTLRPSAVPEEGRRPVQVRSTMRGGEVASVLANLTMGRISKRMERIRARGRASNSVRHRLSAFLSSGTLPDTPPAILRALRTLVLRAIGYTTDSTTLAQVRGLARIQTLVTFPAAALSLRHCSGSKRRQCGTGTLVGSRRFRPRAGASARGRACGPGLMAGGLVSGRKGSAADRRPADGLRSRRASSPVPVTECN